MNRFVFVITSIVAIVFLHSCKTPGTSNSRLAAEGSPKPPLLVVSGGFRSCVRNGSGNFDPRRISFYDSFKQLESRLKSLGHKKIDSVVSCFDGRLQDAVQTIYYVESSEPQIIKQTGRQEYLAVLNKYLNQEKGRPVALIGHSYGGWNVMQVGLDFSKSSANIVNLTTIDPISPETCSAQNILISDTPGKIGFSGCKQAPSDVTKDQRKTLTSSTKIWTNYYQNEFQRLHSSEIPEADNNIKKRYGTLIRSHTLISKDQTVWDEIFVQIKSKLGPSGSTPSDQDNTDPDQDDNDIGKDVFLNILASNSNQFELLAASAGNIDHIGLCRGDKISCLKNPKIELEFESDSSIRITDRKVFRSVDSFSGSSNETYTILAFVGSKPAHAQQVKFVQK